MTGRSLTLAAAAAAAAVAPGSAHAKEIAKVSLCGASDCVTVTQRHFPNETLHRLAENAGETAPPAAAAPWYRVKVHIAAAPEEDVQPFSYTLAYVPSAGLLRGRAEGGGPLWSRARPEARAIFAKLAVGIAPLPAARLTGLDVAPPPARVAEVFAPAASAAGGRVPWLWLAIAVAVVAILAGARAVSLPWSPSRNRRTRRRTLPGR